MIADNFTYYRPETLGELGQLTNSLAGKRFLFYGGGSEIISMARAGTIAPEAVIDVKGISEFRGISLENGVLTIGAAATLYEVANFNSFPLMTAVVSRVADHTNQCRITLGGNVAGTIIYREAVLPLLLTDAEVALYRGGKIEKSPICRLFDKRFNRSNDEAIVSFHIMEKYLSMPWSHAKRTKGEKIDYPVVTIAALKALDGLRFALSGVLGYPFRDKGLEEIFSDANMTPCERAREIAENLPEPPLNDFLAGADWRLFQTRCAIENAIVRLEGNAK